MVKSVFYFLAVKVAVLGQVFKGASYALKIDKKYSQLGNEGHSTTQVSKP
jgi:hypothetical protein